MTKFDLIVVHPLELISMDDQLNLYRCYYQVIRDQLLEMSK